MTPTYRSGSGRLIRPEEQIGDGAAGAAVAVSGAPDAVLKLLAHPTSTDERRLGAMLKVSVPVRLPTHPVVIAWPTDLVFGEDGAFVGFLMPRAPEPAPVNLSTLALRRERELTVGQNVGWDTLLAICCSYSAAVAALHACKVVVCDINLKNVVVSGNLTVTVIDCDSCQFEVDGTLYPSDYFQHGFLAPELDGGRSLQGVRREESSDLWSLAVLIWMTLMDGHHPFSGVWRGSGEPEQEDHAAAGNFPYGGHGGQLLPSPEAPPWRALPRGLQKLFIKAFAKGAKDPGRRPTALEWSKALGAAERRLKQCDGDLGRKHFFPAGENDCPWCEYERYLRSPPSSVTGGRSSIPATANRPKPPFREPAAVAPRSVVSTFFREARLVSGWAALSLAVAMVLGLVVTFAKGAELGAAVTATWHYVWLPSLICLGIAGLGGLLFDLEQWRTGGRFWGDTADRSHFLLSGVAVGAAFLSGAAADGAVPPSAWSWFPIATAAAFVLTLAAYVVNWRVRRRALARLAILAVFAPILAVAWWGAPRDDVPSRASQSALDLRLREAVQMRSCHARFTGKIPPGLFANSLSGLLICRQGRLRGRLFAFQNSQLLALHGSERERQIDSRSEDSARWCNNRHGAYTNTWFKSGHPNHAIGRLLCYDSGRQAVLEWEDPRQDLYGQLRGRNRRRLFHWWRLHSVSPSRR